MITRREWSPTGFSILCLSIDVIMLYFAFLAGFIITLEELLPHPATTKLLIYIIPFITFPSFWKLFVFCMIIFPISQILAGTYRSAYHTSPGYQAMTAVKGIFFGAIFLGAYSIPTGLLRDYPEFLMMFLGFQFILISLFKWLVQDLKLLMLKRDVGAIKIILAGKWEDVKQLYNRMHDDEFSVNYQVVAMIVEKAIRPTRFILS